MNRPWIVLIVGLLLASLATAQQRDSRFGDRRSRTSSTNSTSTERAASTPPATVSEDFRERYGVLVENNIFLRERGRRPPAEPTTQPEAPRRTPEQTYMLTGVVFEEGEFRAYFENLEAGSIVRVAPGDRVARGHITQILIDAVAYASEDRLSWIEIGQDLTGTTAVTLVPQTGGGGSTGSSMANEELLNADPATLSPADRLRRNRLLELNR